MIDQAEGLRRQLDNSKKDIRKAKTISIISGKGGVGKSNFALNFSIELLKRKQKVLLFDLDVGMGNIDILLGLDAGQNIIDMIDSKLSIYDVIEKGPHDLSYISGGTGLTEFFMMDRQKRAYFYEQYYKLINEYDYIIFDMGAGATSESMFFVLASDECIVITTPEPTSITDAYGMIKHIVNNQGNMPIYIVMNRCLSQRHGTQSLERFQHVISQFLQIEIIKMGIVPEDKTVSTAVIRQIPYVLLNDKSAVSKVLSQITDRYLMSTKKLNKLRPLSFIQKLTELLKER